MQTHPMKRIEIMIEAPFQRRMTQAIAAAGARGYTVLAAVAGQGHDGAWREEPVGAGAAMSVIVVVAGAERAPAILAAAHVLLAECTGIVTVGDVQVVRKDHF